jgi:hypothetical protein
VGTLWRVFPWDPAAVPGEAFSPQFLPRQSGQGRFDLPASSGASAWYFAELPEHAVAEKLQHLRNRRLLDEFLFERGRRLAVCAVEVDSALPLADLCEAGEVLARSVAPDRLSYRERSVTQEIARSLQLDRELAGFRWWSSFFGEWHTVVLFSDRLPADALTFGPPSALDLSSLPLAVAARALAIEIVATPTQNFA